MAAKEETLEESLNKSLTKVNLEVNHFQEAIKYDQERLTYFTHVKQYLETELKRIDGEKNRENLPQILSEFDTPLTKEQVSRNNEAISTFGKKVY